MPTLDDFPRLTEEERLDARQSAHELVLQRFGGKPKPEDYAHHDRSEYGPIIEYGALILIVLIFVAAFVISAVHIYQTGRDVYLETGRDQVTAVITGLALVVMAESAIIGLSLAPTLWDTPPGVTRALWLGIAGATMIAVIGNVDATILYTESPFSWAVEWWRAVANAPRLWVFATLPPALTVLVGLSLKYFALSRAKARNAAKQAFDAALSEWEQIRDDPELSPYWRSAYANALWDAWRDAHKRKKIYKQTTFSEALRAAIVRREIKADQWYERALESMDSVPGSVPNSAHGTPNVDSGFSEESPDPLYHDDHQNTRMNKTERIAVHLQNNDEDRDLSVRALAEKFGVGHGTAQRAIEAANKQNGNGE